MGRLWRSLWTEEEIQEEREAVVSRVLGETDLKKIARV